jgi:leucyl/phenylalanyl-tRNA--protein transferase
LPLIRLPEGEDLVAVGGDLRPRRLLAMYRAGIFPWYEEGTPILWWSPNPRAILELNALHVPRRLARTLRAGVFTVTFDRAFPAVIRGCAEARQEGTWITRAMETAYTRLHRLGHARSVEVWRNGALVGGLYGVALGGFFAAESMFHRESNASNVALVALVERLRARGFVLLDLQILNAHTARFGASEIPRTAYLERLEKALRTKVAR